MPLLTLKRLIWNQHLYVCTTDSEKVDLKQTINNDFLPNNSLFFNLSGKICLIIIWLGLNVHNGMNIDIKMSQQGLHCS